MNHVVMLIPGLDPIGGAERQLILLAQGLQRRGWRVSVVALSGTGGEAARELSRQGINFHSLRMSHSLCDPRGWLRWIWWLRRERPEIVHAHLPHAIWMARWSRLLMPVRVQIDTLHTPALGPWTRQMAFRCSSGLPDYTTAVSHAVADVFDAANLVARARRSVLPNGIDCQRLRPDPVVNLRWHEGQQEENFLWLAAGRLEPVKNYSVLLRAFAGLPRHALLAIAGSGSLEASLRAEAAQLQLGERVRFLGFQPDLLPWMQAADGFVLSSLWEGLPMALLEASACALPAVATRLPGVREAIDENGFLCTPGSVNGLRDTMFRLMQTGSGERRALGNTARERILTRFSLETVLDRWEALYMELLEQRPRPVRRAQAFE